MNSCLCDFILKWVNEHKSDIVNITFTFIMNIFYSKIKKKTRFLSSFSSILIFMEIRKSLCKSLLNKWIDDREFIKKKNLHKCVKNSSIIHLNSKNNKKKKIQKIPNISIFFNDKFDFKITNLDEWRNIG